MATKKQTLGLSVRARVATEKVKHLRKAGDVPGVVYGNAIKQNMLVTCTLKDLHTLYVKAGENTLVEVDVDGKKVPCLIHAVSFEPVSGKFEHVDFYAVDMTKKVTTQVPVIVEGESPAIKNQGGVLLTVHDQLEVTCLPADIPSHFVVNISKLENYHDTVMVSSLVVPEGVTIKNAPDTVIVTIQEPRKEEVIETVVAEGAVPAEGAAPGAEGAAAAPGAAAAGAKPGDDKAAGKDAGKDAKKK